MVVGGKRCNQWLCVVPFITNRLPCSNARETVSFVFLCLKANFLSAPKLREAMAPCFFSSRSESLCHAILSLPSWYRFNKQALNSSPVCSSTTAFSASNSSAQFFERYRSPISCSDVGHDTNFYLGRLETIQFRYKQKCYAIVPL